MADPDLRVDGEGSPISLQKFLDAEGGKLKDFTLLIDGTGSGIAHDAPMIYITPEECSKQAIYYSQNLFDGKHIPKYLIKYLSYMYGYPKLEDRDEEEMIRVEVTSALKDEPIPMAVPTHKFLCNLIKYCDKNPEAQQVIGLIQLISGTLNMARKQNKSVRIYIDKPETNLHPSRQSKFMTVFQAMRVEFGGEKPQP